MGNYIRVSIIIVINFLFCWAMPVPVQWCVTKLDFLYYDQYKTLHNSLISSDNTSSLSSSFDFIVKTDYTLWDSLVYLTKLFPWNMLGLTSYIYYQ